MSYIYIYGAPILDVSRSHTTTQHIRQGSSGRVISSSQRPLPDNTRHSQQTNIHAPGGIQTHDLSRRVAAGRSPAEIFFLFYCRVSSSTFYLPSFYFTVEFRLQHFICLHFILLQSFVLNVLSAFILFYCRVSSSTFYLLSFYFTVEFRLERFICLSFILLQSFVFTSNQIPPCKWLRTIFCNFYHLFDFRTLFLQKEIK